MSESRLFPLAAAEKRLWEVLEKFVASDDDDVKDLIAVLGDMDVALRRYIELVKDVAQPFTDNKLEVVNEIV